MASPSPTPDVVPDSQCFSSPMEISTPASQPSPPPAILNGQTKKSWKDIATVVEEGWFVLDQEFLKGKIVVSFPVESGADPIILVA
ncbi:hypothetical protein V2J09_010468 [Rumex salicifolius]